MQQFTCAVTSRGRVTIPKEMRDQLGIDRTGRITFVILDSGTVEIRPVKDTFRDLRGILPAIPGHETEDFDAMFEEAM